MQARNMPNARHFFKVIFEYGINIYTPLAGMKLKTAEAVTIIINIYIHTATYLLVQLFTPKSSAQISYGVESIRTVNRKAQNVFLTNAQLL